MKRKGHIKIVRTEQWEWTAYYGKGKRMLRAAGSSSEMAELRLLRIMVFDNEFKKPKISQAVGE